MLTRRRNLGASGALSKCSSVSLIPVRRHMFISVRWLSKPAFTAGAVFVASMWAAHALAQDGRSFFGIVVDDRTMQPVQGAVVSVLDHARTQVTSADGSFSFGALPIGVVHLRVQREGYSSTLEQVEVVPGGGTFLQLSITPITAVLDEILVRIRSGRSRAELDAVDRSGWEAGATAADLLARRFPGVKVDRGTGAIGGGVEIRIRGMSSITAAREPAIFLDGVRLNPSRPPGLSLRTTPGLQILDEIPASQVRSIRVLRGPSASVVYGESADGVIIIETHHGGVDNQN